MTTPARPDTARGAVGENVPSPPQLGPSTRSRAAAERHGESPGRTEGAPRGGHVLPTVLVVLGLLVAAATVVLDVLDADVAIPPAAALERGWLNSVTGLAQLVPGALLLRRLPRHAVAWVLVVSGSIWLLDGLAVSWAVHALYAAPGAGSTALTSAAYVFYQRFGATLLLGLPLLLLLFPDGRLPRGRVWRPLAVTGIAATTVLPLTVITAPEDVIRRYLAEPPPPPEIAALALDPLSVPLPEPVWQVLLAVGYPLVAVGLLVPAAVVVHRYRAAVDVRRLQLRWLVWAALADVLLVLLAFGLPDPAPGILLCLAVALTSAAIVVAVTRHRLYDIDRLLSSTVVYALLAALVVAVDLGIVAVAGSFLDERGSALAALAVVALVYLPLRDRLWRAVRQAVRGSREDPYAAVATLAQRLELAAGPEEQLRAVAGSVAEAFRLRYVAVEIARPDGERVRVEHGLPAAPTLRLPVVYRGEDVGCVVLPAGVALSDRDQTLLGDLVRQAAAAARASELSVTLQRSREALVLAREEERRRLRRDLHDSLGPSLGAVTLKIETARNLAAGAPDEADQILQGATVDVAAALADVRRLVHDLRPPVLDELGLRRAIEQQAERIGAGGLDVTVGTDELADLPAAVEVAAYRIVSEALTNVAKHARATRCAVSVRRPDAATVEVVVRDDGTGIGADVSAGVGMASLRERAAELGGTATVTCPPGGGTEVRALLPVGGSRG